MRTYTCIQCGRQFQPVHKTQKFCSTKCSAASRIGKKRDEIYKKRTLQARDGFVIVHDPIPMVFAEMQPELDHVYAARIWESSNRCVPFCAIRIGDKSLILRHGEYEEVQ